MPTMKRLLFAVLLTLWAVPAFAQQEVDATALLFWSGSTPRCEMRVGSGAPSGGNTCDSWFDYSAGVFYVKVGGTWSAMAALSATATSTQVCYATGASTIACGDADFTFVTDTATVTKLSTTQLLSSGDIQVDPTGNDVYPTTNYDINLGLLSKKYLTLHAAELWVETLVAQNTLATIGGRILVGPTTTLIADITAISTDIDIVYNNVAIGDIVYMESSGKVEFMQITAGPDPITGGYRVAVTRNLDGSGANIWYAGDAMFNTGTTGDGFIDLYSVSGVQSASQAGPTIVGNVRSSSTYNAWAPRWAIGNLNGLYSYATDIYGVGLGDPSGSNVVIDATNGYRSRLGTTLRQTLDATDGMRFFKSDGTTVAMQLDMAGNAFFTGTITATAGAIGGWTIGATTLTGGNATLASSGNATFGTSNNVIRISADDVTYRLWVGNATAASAPFRVTQAGDVVATSGSVGGWTLGTTTLTGGNATLTNTGNATFGTSNDVIRISADDTTYRLWVGNATAASAPFSVTKAGALVASDATITGNGGFITINSSGVGVPVTTSKTLTNGYTFTGGTNMTFLGFFTRTNGGLGGGREAVISSTISTGSSSATLEAVNVTGDTAYITVMGQDSTQLPADVSAVKVTADTVFLGGTVSSANGTNWNITSAGAAKFSTLQLTGNVISNLLFTDATYDIGASGATRPRNYYGSGAMTIGGLFTGTGSGTNAFNGAVNNMNEVRVSNTTSGTAAGARFYLSDNNGDVFRFTQYSSGFTTSGYSIASSALIEAGGSGGMGIASYGTLRFYTSTTERMRMHNSGGFSIGTTTDPGAANLRVESKIGVGMTPTYMIELSTDSAGKPTSSTWNIVSDEKTKRNITNYVGGLAAIRQVHIHEYDYTGEFGQPAVRGVGPLAGEIQTVFPRSVSTTMRSRDGKRPVEPILAFNAHELFMANVQAVIELDTQVQALTKELAALKASMSPSIRKD